MLFDEISDYIVRRKEKDMIEKNGKEKQTNQDEMVCLHDVFTFLSKEDFV